MTEIKNIDLWQPPVDKDTIHLIAGMSGPLDQDLNNFILLFQKLIVDLQDQDILFLGGDFVQMCEDCCLNPSDSKIKNPNVSSDVCGKATRSGDDCTCENKINQNPNFKGQAGVNLSCCEQDKFKETTNYNGSQDFLIDECLKAMNRGAKIILLDDYIMVNEIYQSNKPKTDYINYRLSENNNFYHYVIPDFPSPPKGEPNQPPHTHAKICTGIFNMKSGTPCLKGLWGSFNPSYPMSFTHEIGMYICGLITNDFVSVLLQYLINIALFFIRSPRFTIQQTQGEPVGSSEIPDISWNGGVCPNGLDSTFNCKPAGDKFVYYDLSQLCSVGKAVYNGNFLNSNKFPAPFFGPNSKGPPQLPDAKSISWTELTAPLTNLLIKLGSTVKTGDPGYLPNSNLFNLYDKTLKNKNNIVVPTVKFCGKVLPPSKNAHKKSLFPIVTHKVTQEDAPYDRIYFEEKNVKFKLGVDSMQFGNTQPTRTFDSDIWECGETTIRSIFDSADKWVKVGIYDAMIESSYIASVCTEKNPRNSVPCSNPQGNYNIKWVVGDSVKKLVDGKKKLFILQPLHGKKIFNTIWQNNSAADNLIFGRYFDQPLESGLHWKFYMSDNSILFSTNHPTDYFYNCGLDSFSPSGTLGYDLKISDSPNLVKYYNNMFQYMWVGKENDKNIVKIENHSGPNDLPNVSGGNGVEKIPAEPCFSCFEGGPGYIPSNIQSLSNTNNNKNFLIIYLIIGCLLLLIIGLIVFFSFTHKKKARGKVVSSKVESSKKQIPFGITMIFSMIAISPGIFAFIVNV